MKRLALFVLLMSVVFNAFCYEPGSLSDKLMNFISDKKINSRQDDVSSFLGKPSKIEEGAKMNVWFYNSDKVNLTIYWNNRADKIDKMVYTTTPAVAPDWDNVKARCLKTGETNIAQVFKAFGMPGNMMIKPINQQLHYSFQYNTLHLFFRKGTLVNYTLF